MATFKDSTGREWRLVLTVETLLEAKANGFDYRCPDSQAERLYQDDVLVSVAAWAFIAKEAKEIGVSRESFLGSMRGEAIQSAREAIEAETRDFFSSATFSRYCLAKEVATKMEQATMKIAEKLEQMGSPDQVSLAAEAILTRANNSSSQSSDSQGS